MKPDRDIQLRARLAELETLEDEVYILMGNLLYAAKGMKDFTLTVKILREVESTREKSDIALQSLLALLQVEDAPP